VRVLILSWRDVAHPEAGGSETFVDRVGTRLAAMGHRVTVFTARYPGSLPDEVVEGCRYVRRGGRNSVYAQAARYLLTHRDVDVVVDIQNGVPFWSPVWSRRPVVAVVHHVHREQWPEVFGPAKARFGWWLESWLAPRLYARERYLTVSEATAAELTGLGIPAARITVAYSGNDLPDPRLTAGIPRTAYPSLVVLGRVVPHKRVELAVDTVAALRPRHPGLRLTVVGTGYWEEQVRRHAERLGVADAVDFAGFVDEATKHRLLAAAWVALLPSVKEGWGLVVVEAAAQGTPTVAFASAGGTQESVIDGVTGLLVDDEAGFVSAVERLLSSAPLRHALGEAAVAHAWQFSWDTTAKAVARVLEEATSPAPRPDDGAVHFES